jgi:hypothetical protein
MTDGRDAVARPHEEGRTVPGAKRRGERLVGLLVAGVLLLNYPLLSLFSAVRLVCGIPVLYLYLFSVWILLIAVAAVVLRDRPETREGGAQERKE